MKTNNPVASPRFLISEHNRYYIEQTDKNLKVYLEDCAEPIFTVNDNIIVSSVIADHVVHLAYQKINGELIYSVIEPSGNVKSLILSKIDPQKYRFKKILVIPVGSTVHLFYAYSTRTVPGLYRIEHRIWNGAVWKSTRLGDIVNPSGGPLFSVNLDSKQNLHLLMITFKGNSSVVITNRYNSSFSIWANPSREFSIPGEVTDITSILSTQNTHYLFWISKSQDDTKIGWAIRKQSHQLNSLFEVKPPISKGLSFSQKIKRIGAIQTQNQVYLWIYADKQYLLAFDGRDWVPYTTEPYLSQIVELILVQSITYCQTYWGEQDKGYLSFIDIVEIDPFRFIASSNAQEIKQTQETILLQQVDVVQDVIEVDEVDEVEEVKIEELEKTNEDDDVTKNVKVQSCDHENPEVIENTLELDVQEILVANNSAEESLKVESNNKKETQVLSETLGSLLQNMRDLILDLGKLTKEVEELKKTVYEDQSDKKGLWSRWFG